MNFLGKILTVFILIVSLLLMYVALTVYATHKNWKADAEGLQKQLAQANATNQELESKLEDLETTLTAEAEDLRRQAAKLETEREVLTSLNTAQQEELLQLRQKSRSDTAAVASTQENNEKLTEQVETLREQIRDHQQRRDEAFEEMIAATDGLHQAKSKVDSLQERNVQLVAQLGEANNVILNNGLDPAAADSKIPEVRGEVLATRRRAGTQLIEVTIGSDDGVKPGHTVEIYRGQRYLGRAEIITTEPDKAVGRVLRRFQGGGQIQEGDNVATKLRVG